MQILGNKARLNGVYGKVVDYLDDGRVGFIPDEGEEYSVKFSCMSMVFVSDGKTPIFVHGDVEYDIPNRYIRFTNNTPLIGDTKARE